MDMFACLREANTSFVKNQITFDEMHESENLKGGK